MLRLRNSGRFSKTEVSFSLRFDLINEVFAEFEDIKAAGNKNYETQAYFTPGIRYKLFEGCEIGAGVPIGLTYESSKWGITAKVLYEW